MYDYGLSTLSRYPLTLENSWRVRGALLCRTGEGIFLLKEFRGSRAKLEKQQELLCKLQEKGFLVDAFLKNDEGELVTEDANGTAYTLRCWYEGRECDTRSEEDVRNGVRLLAELHNSMRLPFEKESKARSLEDEYRRHNQELRKIRKFIYKKGPSGTFETEYLASADAFLKKGEEALTLLNASAYPELIRDAEASGTVCHGEYNQHNVLMTQNRAAAVNFQNWNYDVQMADLYGFMRKILEKYRWDTELAERMLKQYHQTRRISPEEWENLRIRFTYPEKYWKLANYYYCHKKAWISEKTVEKLQRLNRQRVQWEECVNRCFDRYPF